MWKSEQSESESPDGRETAESEAWDCIEKIRFAQFKMNLNLNPNVNMNVNTNMGYSCN